MLYRHTALFRLVVAVRSLVDAQLLRNVCLRKFSIFPQITNPQMKSHNITKENILYYRSFSLTLLTSDSKTALR